MIVVYCLDKDYVEFAEISIKTVKKHNPTAKVVVVSEESLEVNWADEYYIYKINRKCRHKQGNDRISDAAYLKLFLPDILPYDKVLFLDGDVECRKPLDELWEMNPRYIGLTRSHKYGDVQAKALGLDTYYLSGMMLMNLANLRKIDFANKCFEYLDGCNVDDKWFTHEELAINMVMRDKLLELPVEYNYCKDREYDNPVAMEDVYLLHYVGAKNKADMFKIGGRYPELYPLRKEIKDKRIAIVGNSGIIFKGKYGKDIDNHDFVIRFNRGFIKDGECQGTRTDLLILACPMSGNEISMFKPRYVANRSRSYINKADFTINSHERAIMKNALGSQPSTGFIAVNICLTFGAKEISLYGFDGSGVSYPNDQNYKTQHDMKKELEVYKGYEAVGMLKIHGAD